ncbi:MAG: hypothetical protein V1732_02730 [Patescibacteria group bacterium]|nr:hypothetical protein [Patescibacteria group bacterium]
MDKKLIFSLIIGILILGIGLFYWYEWRPSQIVKQCNKEAVEKAKGIEDGNQAIKIYDTRYMTCLREKGLNN